jgi:signal transduction histidine kinase
MTGRDDEHLSALWLATLQRLTDHVAHDIRNALNGVSVNVEVVRSRSARGADSTTISPFAAAASGQLEILSGQVDALVSLLRPSAGRTDVGGLLVRLGALLGGGAGKGTLKLDVPLEAGAPETGAGGTATRLALSAALLGALAGGRTVSCRLGTATPPTVYIECDSGGSVPVADDVAEALARAGILLDASANGITISFPSSPRG